jgi:hypothetical protein
MKTEAQWALVQMLDGVQRHDLPNQLALPDDEIDRIWAAYECARAALAQSEPEGPTDDRIMDVAREADLVYYMGQGLGFASPYMEGADITGEVLAFARAVIALDRSRRAPAQPAPAEHELLAQFDESMRAIEVNLRQARAVMEEALIARRAPVQVADGEVKELVGAIKAEAREERDSGHLHWLTAGELTRIATLLSQLAPVQPVPVGERPWKQVGWCDESGRCWWMSRNSTSKQWELVNARAVLTGWMLPHNALPLPTPPDAQS